MVSRLPKTENLAVAIAENSAHGIVVMDENGYCLFANRAWLDLTGFTEEEMLTQPVHDLVHHHHPDGRPFPLNECPIGCTLGKNQRVRRHEDLFFKKDGTPFPVSCAASPIVKEGAPTLMILEIRDISEEKETARRKDEFLAMLSHELRNPLAPVAAAADLLGAARLDEAGIKRISAVLSRQVKHLTGLVDDLLDVSRVTHGVISLDRENLDINLLISDAAEQVRPLIEEKGHRLDIHTSTESAFVSGDRKRLIQVIANLLNNAAKYTPPEGRIALRVHADSAEIRICVADNGIGMTAAMVGRAFDLFSQADRTPDREQGGLGLGLALVKNLTGLHGGYVAAHSDGPGKGSLFTIFLPRLNKGYAESTAKVCSGVRLIDTVPLKVMVVDDNADAASVLALLLREMGHHVLVQHSAVAALERAASEPQDVFILDIGLPGMDGHQLASALRLQPENSHALMVAITGYGQEKDRLAAYQAGFDHHIIKPASAHQIAELLHRYTEELAKSL